MSDIDIKVDEDWIKSSKETRGRYTQEKIIELLRTNNTMVYKSLMVLYEYKGTALGFTDRFAEEIRFIRDEWYENEAVNINNVEYVRRLLIKGFTHKLLRIANITYRPEPLSVVDSRSAVETDKPETDSVTGVSLEIADDEVNFLG